MYVHMLEYFVDEAGIESKEIRLFFDDKIAHAYAAKKGITQYHVYMMWVYNEV